MSESTDIVALKEKLIKMKPSAIIKIQLNQLSAPIATGIELQKLALMEKDIMLDLILHSPRDKDTDRLLIDPNAIYWAKEYKDTLKIVHELTKSVQEKAALKKMDVITELYKKFIHDKPAKEIIKIIKDLNKDGKISIIDAD